MCLSADILTCCRELTKKKSKLITYKLAVKKKCKPKNKIRKAVNKPGFGIISKNSNRTLKDSSCCSQKNYVEAEKLKAGFTSLSRLTTR